VPNRGEYIRRDLRIHTNKQTNTLREKFEKFEDNTIEDEVYEIKGEELNVYNWCSLVPFEKETEQFEKV